MSNLTKKAFCDWLDRRESADVGIPNEFEDCPFCRFLRDNGAESVYVDFDNIVVDGRCYENRIWQRAFQKRAVNIASFLGLGEITGLTAKKIMDNLGRSGA